MEIFILKKPSELPIKKLLRLQKKLYLSLKRETQKKLGQEGKRILDYQKEYEKDFKNQLSHVKLITKQQLMEEVLTTDITFLSDFHTHSQSQRSALRILTDITYQSQDSWILGLEMISSEHQETLNQFLKDTISEKEFLKIIRYQQTWGMPWKKYQELFIFAKKREFPILALNRPQQIVTQDELISRDQWAAGIIADYIQSQKKDHRFFILYGQWHICSSHLIYWMHYFEQKVLKKNLKILSIHQNHDALYWKFGPQILTTPYLVAKMNSDTACIFSITPWTQLKSLLNYIEIHPNTQYYKNLTNDSDIHYSFEDPILDPIDDAKKYALTVTQFFSIKTPSFEDLNVYLVESEEFLSFCDRELNPARIELVMNCYRNDYPIYFFLGKNSQSFIRSGSFNQIAELACLHIFYMHQANRSKKQNLFYLKILEFCFAFFGTLLLNPKRKCDLYLDHLKAYENLDAKISEKPLYSGEKKARKAILDFFDSNFEIPELNVKLKTLSVSRWMTCRYLGQLLAKNLHQLILSNQESIDTAKIIFFGIQKGIAQTRVKMLCTLMQKVQIAPSKRLEF